jgi:hypothetical protein
MLGTDGERTLIDNWNSSASLEMVQYSTSHVLEEHGHK